MLFPLPRRLACSLRLLCPLVLIVSGCGERPNIRAAFDSDPPPAPDAAPAVPDAPAFEVGSIFPDVPPRPDLPAVADAPPPTDARTQTCGNGIIELTESCDDGNSAPGDGCSGVCVVEPNFTCPAAGQPCVSLVMCGDALITGAEACDDGNKLDGDGCSAGCFVELGYACRYPGQPCTKVPNPACGDGVVNTGESCDDGNTLAGDCCSNTCLREPGCVCPMPGKPCQRDPYCGDGRLDPGEQCDDNNSIPGDGCTGTCQIEVWWGCPIPGMPCQSMIICGDSKIVGDEACDDGNSLGGDGCAASCKQVEPGYTCPRGANNMGGPCTKAPLPICGDGKLDYGEFCDDGNMASNDGCSSMCRVESGYDCPTAGQKCTLVGFCGDGILSVGDGEQCDDHNSLPGDGCSPLCVIEANFVCPNPGQACKSTVVCGDGKVTGGEQCDDRNPVGGDGCSMACLKEGGWVCPVIGAACRAERCGDGLKVGAEQCDDGNTASNDGCSAGCLVEGQDEPGNGWNCSTPNQPCTKTVCGDGMKVGSEQCDQGNNDTGDGCSPFCRVEPTCPAGGGPCTTGCGDGLLLQKDIDSGQECDDGNTLSGDGCSSVCKKEPGYTCDQLTPAAPAQLRMPVVYRDFNACDPQSDMARTPRKCDNVTPFGHPDFETFMTDGDPGIVQPILGANGKPVHVAGDKFDTVNGDAGFAPFDYFGIWYKDDSRYNKAVLDYLTLGRLGATQQYQYDSGTQQFFPIDGKGWNQPGYKDATSQHKEHNFHFTSEVRYWFEFQGTAASPAPQLDFTGDDDVWVFINKHLAVDLGGLHESKTGSIILDRADGGRACDLTAGHTCPTRGNVNLGLAAGNVYEIVVFQAERHTEASHYRLTLSNFNSKRSSCHPVCGDGIQTPDEACDLGTAGNTGKYGTCNANCTLPPRCGDAKLDTANGEQCDDGVNQASYGGTMRACAPGCLWTGYCGDGKVDGAHGEACDEGTANGSGYGHCGATCRLGPRCGDGVTTDNEECDDGKLNGSSGSKCTDLCTRKCGNGVVDPGEVCDSGKINNTGGYGKCNPDCSLGPRCGDGIKNGSEACDDGKNDGTYGNCANGCVLGPRCGDGVIQGAAGEVCDLGAGNAATAYGKNTCNDRCKVGPYCGDKRVDTVHCEVSDDGTNSGQPGSCTPDCKGFVPLPTCGDGVMNPGEQCDQGVMNGATGGLCDVHCKLQCGNGVLDAGEKCDDGVNNGAYGTCKPGCLPAAYCGDGMTNGPEQCDLGSLNEANPYGVNKCTTSCTIAPYCGDKRLQAGNGEQCDGTPECSASCQKIIIQ